MQTNLQVAESVEWKRVRLPEEFNAICRLIVRVGEVRREAMREAQLQDTRLYSAFDEVDWEWARTFDDHPRKDIEKN